MVTECPEDKTKRIVFGGHQHHRKFGLCAHLLVSKEERILLSLVASRKKAVRMCEHLLVVFVDHIF